MYTAQRAPKVLLVETTSASEWTRLKVAVLAYYKSKRN